MFKPSSQEHTGALTSHPIPLPPRVGGAQPTPGVRGSISHPLTPGLSSLLPHHGVILQQRVSTGISEGSVCPCTGVVYVCVPAQALCVCVPAHILCVSHSMCVAGTPGPQGRAGLRDEAIPRAGIPKCLSTAHPTLLLLCAARCPSSACSPVLVKGSDGMGPEGSCSCFYPSAATDAICQFFLE